MYFEEEYGLNQKAVKRALPSIFLIEPYVQQYGLGTMKYPVQSKQNCSNVLLISIHLLIVLIVYNIWNITVV